MRILVTGGAGFIGSHVADRYIGMGHEVAVLDDLSSGSKDNLNPRAQFFQVSLLGAGLNETLKNFRPEVISHHAAQVNVRRSVDDPEYDANVNIIGAIKLFRAAADCGCRKIIYASSGGACYGEPKKIPAPEETPIRPLCPYGVSKYTVEKYLELFSDLHGFEHTILRYANVFGPRQNPHGEAGVVAVFSEMMLDGKRPSIFGDGTKTRDYVYVKDIAEANALALNAGNGAVYNIGTGVETTDDEVFSAIRDAIGTKMEPIYSDFRLGEVRRVSLDASRIRKELGWKPTVRFVDGIAEAVKFYCDKRKAPKG